MGVDQNQHDDRQTDTQTDTQTDRPGNAVTALVQVVNHSGEIVFLEVPERQELAFRLPCARKVETEEANSGRQEHRQERQRVDAGPRVTMAEDHARKGARARAEIRRRRRAGRV